MARPRLERTEVFFLVSLVRNHLAMLDIDLYDMPGSMTAERERLIKEIWQARNVLDTLESMQDDIR